MHHGVLEGSGHPWIPTWTRFGYGQISVETATHSLISVGPAYFGHSQTNKLTGTNYVGFTQFSHRNACWVDLSRHYTEEIGGALKVPTVHFHQTCYSRLEGPKKEAY